MALLFLVAMIHIDIIKMVGAKTSHCNYAVDLWWLQGDPPSQSPTPAPTNSPSKSPSQAPTFLNEIRTTREAEDWNVESLDSKTTSMSTIILLNPYPINSCYSLNFTEEPFNAVSIKYTCNSAQNTLTRNIYWDSLECDGGQVETTEITASEQGQMTTFVCNAATDCPVASIEVQSALTNSPTPEPTNSPTTPEPTKSPVTDNEGTVDDDDDTNVAIRENSSSDSDSGSCDGSLGPNPNADKRFSWQYAQNICIDASDLKALFEDTSAPTRAPTAPQPTPAPNVNNDGEDNVLIISESDSSGSSDDSFQSLGWFCRNNRYALAVYNTTDCEGDPIVEGIAYKNDWCVFGNDAWAYVECEPTIAPTQAPTQTACTTDSDCDANELCVTGSGECRSKIAEDTCATDSDCNDGYECDEDNTFCYFSECGEDGDCDGYESQTEVSYTCNRLDGSNANGDSYSYGVCAVEPNRNSGDRLSGFTVTKVIFIAMVSFVFGVIA